MPAYRSEAEKEIRDEVVMHLRRIIPGCRIIHEINAASFGNRIDVLAVGEDRLAAVEIKSSKDKLDRLPAQIAAMNGVSNLVFAAIHEKFLDDVRGNAHPPKEVKTATTWVYPRKEREGHIHCREKWHNRSWWDKELQCLPDGALWMLWRKELQDLCRALKVKGVAKLTMEECIDHIKWNMTGAQITSAVCVTLRARECIEADPPIAANDNTCARVTETLFA